VNGVTPRCQSIIFKRFSIKRILEIDGILKVLSEENMFLRMMDLGREGLCLRFKDDDGVFLLSL